jgi:serine/threonine protein kinase
MSHYDAPDYCGTLRKKGGTIKAYRRRWFELRGKHLYYFKNQETKQPSGVIVLTGAQIDADRNKRYQINIKGSKLSRLYELQAENEPDFKRWMEMLNKAIEELSEVGKVTGKVIEQERKELAREKKQRSATLVGNTRIGLDHFDLLCVVGRGSFGKVMKVRKKGTNEIYAMKVLRKETVVRENMIGHTKAEKNILAEIDHPFIVKLHYAFQTDEKLYLVLDFLSGGELFFHLSEHNKFDIPRARFYAAEIVLALSHLHSKDIIYRDLKPENAVLDSKGHVVLTDFGLAKTQVNDMRSTYTFCGTPEYLAPEILKGQGHGKGVDWWSLGILLYEMVVGLPPFYSENINDMYDLILKSDIQFPKSVPADLQNLLQGLLERDEKKRLGCLSKDASEIKNHRFFAGIDWDKLYRRQITPPFIPQIQDDDTKFFDTEFTREIPVDSVAEVFHDTDNNFDNFEFDGRK